MRKDKSYKREVAALGLLFWMAISIQTFWFASVEKIVALSVHYTSVTTTIWLFAAAAFGLQSILAKMYPEKEEKTDNRVTNVRQSQ